MLEHILTYERDAFFMLNGSNSPYLDSLMWLYSGKVVWLPLAFLILMVIIYKKNWRESLFILLAIVLVITLCDQFASHLCKPLFTRLRPTHHPDFMDQVKVVYGYRGGKYGFMSSHAANAFGFATFLALLFKNKLLTIMIFIWAIITAYSRIYLGVHFISDVVPGAVTGMFWGYLVYKIYTWMRQKLIPEAAHLQPENIYSENRKRLIVYGILVSFLILLISTQELVAFLH